MADGDGLFARLGAAINKGIDRFNDATGHRLLLGEGEADRALGLDKPDNKLNKLRDAIITQLDKQIDRFNDATGHRLLLGEGEMDRALGLDKLDAAIGKRLAKADAALGHAWDKVIHTAHEPPATPSVPKPAKNPNLREI